MVTFRNLPIKRKLRYAMLITAYAVLLVTLSIQTISDLLKSRSALVSNLETLAEVIGTNAQAALVFEDHDSAQRLLKGFSTAPHIQSAYLMNPEGDEVASYHRSSSQPWAFSLDDLERPITVFSNTRLHLYRPITMDNQLIGAIYIQSNLSQLYLQLSLNLILALVAALISVVLASVLASRLESLLGKPIRKLANTISQMTRDEQYDQQVHKFDDDEIGALYDCFNEMLMQIKERDQRLQQHRENLEASVAERTRELHNINKELKVSIKELNEAKEAALDAAKAKSSFLANMSHEIRTPMNGVLGMLELLSDTRMDRVQQDFLATAHSSADSLLHIINDILDFSKIEAGKMEIEQVDMNPAEIAEDICALLAGKAVEKGLELSCYTDIDLPAVVRGDPVRLRQVLTNLVGNAIKFTEQGEVGVRLILLKRSNDSVQIEFLVEDTGIGIAKDVLSTLFSAFIQADGSTTRKFGGTGLGLTISKQLVDLMGGEVKVTSAEGLGSTFAFILNLDVSESKQLESSRNVSHALDGIRALIVDDNATNREILRHYLTAWGIVYSEASDGKEALNLMLEAAKRSTPFELVLLDMDMPEMDGLTLSKAISDNPDIANARRIMLTSAGFVTRSQQKEVGISACLSKPYRQSRLLDTTMQVMYEHHVKSAEPAAIENSSTFSEKIRLLLVEDNIVNQKVAVSMLKKVGLGEPDIANDGREAVSMSQKNDYDLILMDCMMPEMSGYEATTLIRKRESAHKLTRVPIIAMTANAMQGDREKCLAAGMDDYISKPIKADIFKDKLEHWLIYDLVDENESDPPESSAESKSVALKQEGKELINSTTLNTLKDIMEDEFSGLLESYLEDAPMLMRDIQQSAREADLKVMVRAAHTLKSSSNNLGARLLAETAQEIETLGKENKLAEASALIPDLEQFLERTVEAIKKL
ncbi:MAG: response regulator [Endozoicomonas sp.]